MSRPLPIDPQSRMPRWTLATPRYKRGYGRNRRPDSLPRRRDLVPLPRRRAARTGGSRCSACTAGRARTGSTSSRTRRSPTSGASSSTTSSAPATRRCRGRTTRRCGCRSSSSRRWTRCGRRSASSACTSSATPGAGCSACSTPPASRQGLASLIVESSPASVPAWMPELQRLRSELPPEVEATLRDARGGGQHRRPGLRGSGDGLLPTPSLPRRPVAGLARRVLHDPRVQPRGLPLDERPERVPRDRHDQGLGHHRPSRARSRRRRSSSRAATTR